jgi:hypothetical protein
MLSLQLYKEFKDMVQKDFAGLGLYLMDVLKMISKLATTSTNPFPAIAPNMSMSPSPLLVLGRLCCQNLHHHLHQYQLT